LGAAEGIFGVDDPDLMARGDTVLLEPRPEVEMQELLKTSCIVAGITENWGFVKE